MENINLFEETIQDCEHFEGIFRDLIGPMDILEGFYGFNFQYEDVKRVDLDLCKRYPL